MVDIKRPYHDKEAWLFEPENKEVLAKIKRGLKQKGTIRRGSFVQKNKIN
jgi:hypothetical protein